MNNELTRREFIQYTSIAYTGAALGVPLLSGCGSTPELTTDSAEPVHYPRLPGHKIQSPEHYGLDGCMTGIWFPHDSPEWVLNNYKEMVGKSLSYYILPHRYQSNAPMGITRKTVERMEECARIGVIPFIAYDMQYGNSGSQKLLDEFIAGEFDDHQIDTAKKLKAYGEKHGGFFIKTMREMNMANKSYSGWPYWGRSSKKVKKIWKRIWNIFETEGANDYATWVFNPYVAQGFGIGRSYYPGDEFVDWIGFNGYNWDGQRRSATESFRDLFYSSYKEAQKYYKYKPKMIVDTGMSNLGYKGKWVRNAFQSVKIKMPGIKGVSWYHEYWSHNSVKNFDTRINSSPKALEGFKEGISDPYFLGKIPYKL